jgi:hypothetical protein
MTVNIDRELQAALDVDPSPEFVARVRMRIASEPAPRRWGFGWMAVAVGAAAAIVVAVVVTRSIGERKESGELLAARSWPVVAAPIDPGSPQSLHYDDRAAASPMTAGADLGRPQAEPAPPLLAAEILVDPREAAAIRRLIAGVSAGRIDLNRMLKPSPFVVADMSPVEDIEIEPLSIEPLNASGEGARP